MKFIILLMILIGCKEEYIRNDYPEKQIIIQTENSIENFEGTFLFDNNSYIELHSFEGYINIVNSEMS